MTDVAIRLSAGDLLVLFAAAGFGWSMGKAIFAALDEILSSFWSLVWRRK